MSAHVWFREVKCECGATTICNIVNTRYSAGSFEYWVSCNKCTRRVSVPTEIIPEESLPVIRNISDQLWPRWPYTSSVSIIVDNIADVLSDMNARLEKLESK